MKTVLYESDYAPGTYLRIVQTDDGDIIFKITGSGEMRIATSGGSLHGNRLNAVCAAACTLIEELSKTNDKLKGDE